MTDAEEPILFRFDEAEPVREPSNDLVMRALLRTGESGADVSVTWVQLEGEHRWVRSRAASRFYYVIEGRGRFEFEGRPSKETAPGDLVVIPVGLLYRVIGPMTYLVMNQPGFREGDDDYPSAR